MTDISRPKWLLQMDKYLGLHEIHGPQHNPTILKLIDEADGKLDGKQLQGIKDDETPWCASFLSGVLEEAGIVSARTAWALNYAKWGVPVGWTVGAIAVLSRNGGGHVTMVVGRDAAGNFIGEGGNQGDMVKLSPFSVDRIAPNGLRWPAGQPLPAQTGFATLPLIDLNHVAVSTNEK